MKFVRNDPTFKERRRELRRNQTDAEKALWTHIRARQLQGMKFFRQYSIGPYILDFYCPQMKLAIEVDGGQHSYDENQKADTVRTEYMKTHGIHVIRFWNHEILQHLDSVVAIIADYALHHSSANSINPLTPS